MWGEAVRLRSTRRRETVRSREKRTTRWVTRAGGMTNGEGDEDRQVNGGGGGGGGCVRSKEIEFLGVVSVVSFERCRG